MPLDVGSLVERTAVGNLVCASMCSDGVVGYHVSLTH
jgi:hypothetical protein